MLIKCGMIHEPEIFGAQVIASNNRTTSLIHVSFGKQNAVCEEKHHEWSHYVCLHNRLRRN